jgi:hypothetical protein
LSVECIIIWFILAQYVLKIWTGHYPAIYNSSIESENGQKSPDNDNDRPRVEFADIGCGYGGLLGETGDNHGKTVIVLLL